MAYLTPITWFAMLDTESTSQLKSIQGLSLIKMNVGLQNGKIAGSKLFAPPPPQDRIKLLMPPLLKSGKFSRPPTIWLKLQATA